MTAQNPLLERLTPRIRGAAHNVARQYGADPDDVEQEIVLAILERYAENPDFLNQTPAYVVNHGAWRARDALRREAVQSSRCLEDAPVGDDPDGPTLLDLAAATNPWPEVELRVAVEQVLARALDRQSRRIALSLAMKCEIREIAEALRVAPNTVRNRINGPIAQALACFAA